VISQVREPTSETRDHDFVRRARTQPGPRAGRYLPGVPTRDPLRRFGYLTPRIVYALAMLRELAVTLPVADPPPRATPRPARRG